MHRRTSAWLTLALAAAACAGGRADGYPRPAPAFELRDLAGGSFRLSELRGKVVVLDFWATWCGPCIAEIPDYAEFARRNRPRGIEVVGVVMESGSPGEIQDAVRELRIPYRQLVGESDVREAFGVTEGYPTTFVIDRQGMIRSKTLGGGGKKFQGLQESVDDALASS